MILREQLFKKVILTAICLVTTSCVSLVVISLGLLPLLSGLPAGICALVGVAGLCMAGWVAVTTWRAANAPRQAYKVTYHSSQALDGREATRILEALARKGGGQVSVVWSLDTSLTDDLDGEWGAEGKQETSTQAQNGEYGEYGERDERPCLYVLVPAGMRDSFETTARRLLPGILVERCVLHRSTSVVKALALASAAGGDAGSWWRWSLQAVGKGTATATNPLTDPLVSGLHLEALYGLGVVEVRINLAGAGIGSGGSVVVRTSKATDNNNNTLLNSLPLKPLLGRMPLSGVSGGRIGSWLTEKVASNFPLWNAWPVSEYSKIATAPGTGTAIAIGFPETTKPSTRHLDSLEAKQIALRADYALPPDPSRVLALGDTTLDARPVGIPTLSRTKQTQERSSTSAPPPPSPPSLLSLHPLFGGHLLAAGGTSSWRRDLAALLAVQTLEKGMDVLLLDGGTDGDEFLPHLFTRLDDHLSTRSSYQAGTRPGVEKDSLSPVSLGASVAGMSRRMVVLDIQKWVSNNTRGMHSPLNMLRVPRLAGLGIAHPAPAAEGEAWALLLALRTALPAQMRFLDAMKVTGGGTGGIGGSGDREGSGNSDNSGSMAVVRAIAEAWLGVLLLRHHRARLREAIVNRATSPPSTSPLSEKTPIPMCPDLGILLQVVERVRLLQDLIEREQRAWQDPDWQRQLNAIGSSGSSGASGSSGSQALQEALNFLTSAQSRLSVSSARMPMHAATLHGKLTAVFGEGLWDAMSATSGTSGTEAVSTAQHGEPQVQAQKHTSLYELLEGPEACLLQVILPGRGKSVLSPREALARRVYGLYMLWALWGYSRQRVALYQLDQRSTLPVHATPVDATHPIASLGPTRPMLSLVHGASACLAGSPLQSEEAMKALGAAEAGISVALVSNGLRQLRQLSKNVGRGRPGAMRTGYAGLASASHTHPVNMFSCLILGALPTPGIDLTKAERGALDAEVAALHAGVNSLKARRSDVSSGADTIRQVQSEQLGRVRQVLSRIEDGQAVVVLPMPGGRWGICTARVGREAARQVLSRWQGRGPGHNQSTKSVGVPPPAVPILPVLPVLAAVVPPQPSPSNTSDAPDAPDADTAVRSPEAIIGERSCGQLEDQITTATRSGQGKARVRRVRRTPSPSPSPLSNTNASVSASASAPAPTATATTPIAGDSGAEQARTA